MLNEYVESKSNNNNSNNNNNSESVNGYPYLPTPLLSCGHLSVHKLQDSIA